MNIIIFIISTVAFIQETKIIIKQRIYIIVSVQNRIYRIINLRSWALTNDKSKDATKGLKFINSVVFCVLQLKSNILRL